MRFIALLAAVFSPAVFAYCDFDPLFSVSEEPGYTKMKSMDESVAADWDPSRNVFRLFNLKTFKIVEVPFEPTKQYSTPNIDFSLDGKTVVVWNEKHVKFFETKSGKLLSEGRTLETAKFQLQGIGFTEDSSGYMWVTEERGMSATYVQHANSGEYRLTYLGSAKLDRNFTHFRNIRGLFVVPDDNFLRILNAKNGRWLEFDLSGELGNTVRETYYSPFIPVVYVKTDGLLFSVDARDGKIRNVIKNGGFCRKDGNPEALRALVENRYLCVGKGHYVDLQTNERIQLPLPEGAYSENLEQVVQAPKAMIFNYYSQESRQYNRLLRFMDGSHREIQGAARVSINGNLFTREDEDVFKIMDLQTEEVVWRIRYRELEYSTWIDFSDDSRYLIVHKPLGNHSSLAFYDIAKKRKVADTPPIEYGRVEFPRSNPEIFKARIVGENKAAYYRMPLCKK